MTASLAAQAGIKAGSVVLGASAIVIKNVSNNINKKPFYKKKKAKSHFPINIKNSDCF